MSDENDIIYTQPGLDIGAILRWFYELITGSDTSVDGVVGTFYEFWQIFSIIAFAFAGLFLFGIIYAKLRTHELEEAVDHALEEAEHLYAHTYSAQSHSKNERWDQAVAHAESDNPNDWRLAIIEADIILEEVLTKLGYAGLTIGDKLKQASPQFFTTIEDAWKAHKVRNDIAHRGSDFILTKRLVKETIEQYRRVFVEHGAI